MASRSANVYPKTSAPKRGPLAADRKSAIRTAAGRSELHEARCGAVRDAHAVAEHDDDVSRPAAVCEPGSLDDERGRCRGGPVVVAHLCGDGVAPRFFAGEAAQVETAVERGSGESDAVGSGGRVRPLRDDVLPRAGSPGISLH